MIGNGGIQANLTTKAEGSGSLREIDTQSPPSASLQGRTCTGKSYINQYSKQVRINT